jgi:hypothetical protein
VAALPYVTAPGNIDKALRAIKAAATPERVSQDFVKTILKIPGGSGDQMTSYLRKVGFVNADGSPSDIYKKFRNTATTGRAAADSLKTGYAPLYARNEFMYQLSDDKLRGLVIEETGQGADSSVVGLVVACIKAIKKFADWSEQTPEESESVSEGPSLGSLDLGLTPQRMVGNRASARVNLSYTINLNLPATSDVAVFNAIFKSLKDHLLRDAE